MSFLGIRGSSTLHRQLTSPRSQDFSLPMLSPSVTSDVSQDSRDVLVQRLADLSTRLASATDLADADVTALHVDVDRMERILRGKAARVIESSRESPATPRRGSFSRTMSGLSNYDADGFWGPTSPLRSPQRSSSALFASFSSPPSPDLTDRPSLRRSHDRLAIAMAEPVRKLETNSIAGREQLLAKEAEKLLERLTTALEELKVRKDETSRLHDLVISSNESATNRIGYLQNQLHEIHEEHETFLSKLSFLRIQLRAIEVQGSQYIQFGEDAELSTSIMNWKLEWADVDMKIRNSKKRYEDSIRGQGVSVG